jgi:ferric-dicitrate binding protein FerR (iron transport regulator)
MSCEDAWNLISARMDGQLAEEDRARLEAHLAECDACRSAGEAFRAGDAALRRAFAPGRQAAAGVAERTVARLRAAGQGAPHARRPALQLAAAAAAGFLLAALVFQPWARTPPAPDVAVRTGDASPKGAPVTAPPVPAPPLSAARLAFATGGVEVRERDEDPWRPLARGDGAGQGARIRTAPGALAEIRMADGSTVRLNESTEVRIERARGLDLVRGRLWSEVARDETPFVVTVPDAVVTALGTKFDVDLQGGKAWLTVLEGATKVTGAGEAEIVRAGERARIEGGRVLEKTRAREVVMATSWVNKLLIQKGDEGKTELASRLEDLLAAIGDAKVSHLRAAELQDLGESCVRPLISYLASPRSRGRTEGQETAARAIADLAPRWAVRDVIIHLLPHENGIVRAAAARALERLTGETQGRPPEDWEKQPWVELEPAYRAWLAWWEENKARYPPER